MLRDIQTIINCYCCSSNYLVIQEYSSTFYWDDPCNFLAKSYTEVTGNGKIKYRLAINWRNHKTAIIKPSLNIQVIRRFVRCNDDIQIVPRRYFLSTISEDFYK